MGSQRATYKTKNVVQFMIARGCVLESEFRNVMCKMLDTNPGLLDDEKIFTIVQATNTKISPFNMMIRAGIDEITHKKYYVLISTVDNQITRAASLYNAKELELFKFSLQAMINDPRATMDFHGNTMGSFTGIAIKVGVPPADRKKLFDEWCRKHWFTRISESEVTLGVRSMTELDVFIKEHLLDNPSEFEQLIKRQKDLRKELRANRKDELDTSVRIKQQPAD